MSPLTYRLTFPSSAYDSRVDALFYKASATDPTKLDPATVSLQWTGTARANSSTLDYAVQTSATYTRWVKFRRTRSTFLGTQGEVSVSNPVLIPAATTTTATSTTSGTPTTTTPPAPTGTVVGASAVTVAAGATLAVGSTAAAPGSRWMSLDDSVATVDASGTISGRTAGVTKVLAVTTAADGSLRVVAIPVTVP